MIHFTEYKGNCYVNCCRPPSQLANSFTAGLAQIAA